MAEAKQGYSQVDDFLRIDGIEGEAQDSKHTKEIEVLDWSWSEKNEATTGSATGGSGIGKVKMQDFEFTMHVNKASPKLMLACASGEHIPKAVLTSRKAGGSQEEYLKVTFSGCFVSSYKTGRNGEGVLPIDQITLAFSRVEMEYKPQTKAGSLSGPVKAGWDQKQNRKV